MPKEKTGYYIKCIANEIRRYQDENAERAGLSATQAYILAFLHGNEQEGKKVRQCDLEKWLNIRAPSVTGLLVGMERAKLIVRTNAEEDVRAKNVELTERGRAVALRGMEQMKALDERMMTGFTPQERAELTELLQRALYNVKNIKS
jgi:DNA-binding MarR family transcriptional regulator